jgi:N-acetyl-anhydromuramyl-L-alanine amidase AmpD
VSKDIDDKLYTAKWHLQEAINTQNYGSLLDKAHDLIYQAKADSITEEPERPDVEIPGYSYKMPKIVVVPGIKFKTRGNFRTPTGEPEGVLVHYTVSGGTKQSAIAVLRSLAKRGLGCPVMAHDGTIYIPEGYDLMKDVVYHAGKSAWNGKTGMSAYLVGLEVCCWGRLNDKTRKYANVIRKGDDGDYEAYTPEQEEGIRNFIMMVADMSGSFDPNMVLGHHEVSPGRKTDPKASLQAGMANLRKEIINNIATAS